MAESSPCKCRRSRLKWNIVNCGSGAGAALKAEGGKWTYIDVAYNYVKGYDFGHEPIGRNYVRGEIKACQSMEVYISDNDDWDNYAYYQLDYHESYTAILDGGIYLTWEFDLVLACDTWKPLWFAWEGTSFSMGRGLEPNVDTYLTADFGRSFSKNILILASLSTEASGQWRWLTDEPPLFNSPSPDGNEALVIPEDTAQYQAVYVLGGTDPEDDEITFATDTPNTNYFQVYYGYIYLMETLDYETNGPNMLITLTANDGRHTVSNTMLLKVTNVYDVTPTITAHILTLPEGTPVGTNIGSAFTVVDGEEGDSLTYAISGSHSDFLSCDSSSGQITIAKLMDSEATTFDFSGLSLSVTDLGGNQATSAFDLTISDYNDNIPTFSQDYYEVIVNDGSSSGDILTVAVADNDVANQGISNFIFSQDGSTSGFSFSLSGNTLSITAALDYESREAYDFKYVLVLQAVDSPPSGDPLTGTAAVVVKIEPVNEHTPYLASTPPGSSIAENTDELTVITTISAADDDLGPDGVLTYSIDSVTPASGTGLFTVDASTGEVKVGGQLDADAATGGITSYSVSFSVSDNGATPKSTTGSITVSVTGVNDNSPFFDQSGYTVNVDEGSAVTMLAPVTSDHDGDALTLTIQSGNDDGLFVVQGSSVDLAAALDYETSQHHVLILRVSDGTHSSDVPMVVNVQDIKDESPTITVVSNTSMAEEQTIGTRVSGGLVASDPDAADTLSYTISGSGSTYLNIDSSTGELTVAQNVDYDSGLTQLVFTVTVTDTTSNQASETVTISVEDINDLFPVFNPSVYEAEVTENSAANTALADLTCSDGDTGNNALFDVSVAGGDGGAGIFKMSGLQLLTDSSPADYEAVAASGYMYTLVITAVDTPDQGEANTGTAIVKVTVKPENEFDPVWSNPVPDASSNFAGTTVSEGEAPGYVITTFQATDADLEVDGEITFSITSVTGASGATATNKFSIDSTTGELTVAGALDVDAGTNGEASYTIGLRASDRGTSSRHVDGTVVVTLTNVNDNAPYYDQTDYKADVSEDSSIGVVVVTLATDDYDGDVVNLAVASGRDDLFECVGNDVRVKAALDFETDSTHVLIIRASDGVFETDVSVQVNVQDVSDEDPVITMVTTATMAEEQAPGTGVYGGYLVTDPDAGDNLTYVLSGADSGYLSIDSATGALSVAQNVNREGSSGKTQLDLTLTVTDQGGQQATQAFSITVEDINDLPPVFNPSEFTAEITENSAADVSLLDVTCSDGDTGNNALYDITVASGDGGAGIFKMSGLQLLTDSTPADYEALGSSGYMYTLIITAVDKPDNGVANTGTAIVRVTVKSENEFDPVWSNPVPDGGGNFAGATVSEGDAPGTALTGFTATDADLGDDGDVTYSIASVTAASGASSPDTFSIAPTTGELMVAGVLDVDVGTNGESSYTIVVRASDNGATARTVDGNIVVTLTNINDNAPNFDQTDYTASVSEASVAGTGVITLITDDFDGDAVTLSVASGRDDLFECVGNEVRIKAPLDYETDTYHVVTIRASDGVFDADVPLQINVQDASDESPVIVMVAAASMAEEQALGTGVYGGYIATDADANDTIIYDLSGADSSFLNIDSTTGELSVARHVNRDGSSGKTQLDLILTVTDQGGMQATQAFSIIVEDINDLTPVFATSEYSVEIVENSAADLSLLDLTCSDGDTGNNALFDVTVASGDGGAGIFKMSGLQLLTDSTPSDYEAVAASGNMYTLVITAVDTPDQGAPNTGTAIIRVTVKPENEFDPVWTSPASDGVDAVDIDEDSAPGAVISAYRATDDDLGVDGDITYSIVSVVSASGADGSDKFTIDAVSGNVMVGGELDVDTATGGEASYTVSVRASDNGVTPRSVDGSITFTLLNINDNAPAFDQSTFQANLNETSAVDTTVINFNIQDHDGDAVTLSIASGRDDLFTCDGHDVKVKAALDFETDTAHVLVIRANDGKYDTDVSLEINVADVFDEAPIITIATTSSMAEEQTTETAVDGGYVATDADAGDVLTYALSGPDSGYFAINSTTGELTMAQNLDRDAGKSEVSLTLTVTDQTGLVATKDFTILLVDINDLPPVFNPMEYSVEVIENTSPDTSLLDLTCTDSDDGNNAVFNVVVQHGDDTSTKFKMNDQQLQTDNLLDYESVDSYTLVITAVDTPDQGEANTGTAIVKVTVKPENEFDPVWTGPASDGSGTFTGISVTEGAIPGSVVTTFAATDDDEGNDGVVTYSIVSVTAASGTTVADKFSVLGHTGDLLVASPLDVDSGTNGEASYTIVVKASDNGATARSVEGTITVSLDNVNDNAPVFNQTEYQADLSEDSAVDTVVIAFKVQDHDGDAVTLTISNGRDDLFACDGNDVKVKAALDFETDTYHVLVIRASDGKFEVEVSLQVDIVDVIDEAPVITMATTSSVAEEQTTGTGVYGGYIVTDADKQDVLVYTLTGADSAYLSIDSATGELTVAQHINREGTSAKSALSLTLTVTDQAGLQATQDFTITVEDINDLPPVFNPSVYEIEVTENTVADFNLLELTCTDGDAGNNAVFATSLAGGDDTVRKFQMVDLKLLSADNAIDYESLEASNYMYTLIITAVDTPNDGEAMTGTAIVKVTVVPENEFNPVWTAPTSSVSGSFDDIVISEDTSVGSVLTVFNATDNDKADDGLVTYTITGTNSASGTSADGMFSVDSHTGELIVTGTLDYDAGTNGAGSYTLSVKASDSGHTPREVAGTVAITLTNVNDNAPVFDQSEYHTSVAEDSGVGAVVVSLINDDFDGDDVNLSIATGRDDLFECDGNDIIVKAALDFETDRVHVLIIRASDGVHETDVSVKIDIVNVIDQAPVISMATTTSMAEEQTVGTPVEGGYVVTDADEKDVLTYVLSGVDSHYLTINSSSGDLSVATNVDREGTNAKTELSLTLTVTDQAGLQATQDLTIKVEDINDQLPVCDQTVYEIEVTENTPGDTELLDFVCVDSDVGNNAQFDLTLASGDDTANKFKIGSSKLSTDATDLDYEALEASGYMYTLVITAVDTPDQGEANTGTAIVKVTVLPENEFDPVWTGPASDGSGTFTGLSVSEDEAPGFMLTTFTATDDDYSDDGVITYSIVSITAASGASVSDIFIIDAHTGELIVADDLDVDSGTNGEASYTIVVKASDNGATARSVEGTITVSLDNVNDNAPVFDQTEYQADLSEDSVVDTVVITLNTEDFDDDSVTLSIISGREDLFKIDGNDVKVKDALLDYESTQSHLLYIKATDGTFESRVSLHVTVLDVIDEAPVITIATTGAMSEGQAITTGVHGGFHVTDLDELDVHIYALTGAHSHYLSIDTGTGYLSVAEHVDRDGASGVTELTGLTLTVTDQAGLQDTKDFTVTIVDVNDLAPVFDPAEYRIEVTENTAAGTSLLDFLCTDGDSGNNAVFVVGVGDGDDSQPKFKMSGQQLQTDGNLDYDSLEESGYMYTLIITAVDTPDQGEANTGTAIVKVTVKPENEFDPVWTGPASDGSGTFTAIFVREDLAPGDVAVTFIAVDDDLGVDGDVAYSIVSVTAASGADGADRFSIDAATGGLLVAGKLDVDSVTGGEPSYTVVVKASDNGQTPRETQGTITISLENVNDIAPVFDQTDYETAVDEDVDVGVVVMSMVVVDHDGDTVTLTIASGRDDLFMCDGYDVKVKTPLDFETEDIHILVIRASDGTFTTDFTIHVSVNDVLDEAPVITVEGTASMAEGQVVRTGVYGGLSAMDADAGDTLTYSLSGVDSGYLTIDPTTGELSVEQNVDREGPSGKTELSLTLTVTDQAGLQATQDFTITVEDINDLPPKCDPAVFITEVTENTAEDVVLLDLTCTDDDDGNNAIFTVSIGSGDDTDPKFKMSGKQLLTNSYTLDFESLKDNDYMYTLVITAVDTPDQGEANTGTAIVKVTVKPENEFDPVWSDPVPDVNGYLNDVTVDEDAAPGTAITTVTATDDDQADDGVVVYEITSITVDDGSDALGTFVIGYDTGDLQVKSGLDAEGGITRYDISLRAVDLGTPPKDVTASIKVFVNNVNDMAPEFSDTKYQTLVYENVTADSAIFTLAATDPDGDTVTFALEETSDLFEVRGDEVFILKTLDFETRRYYSTIISASDGIHTTYVSFIVNVGNIMDEQPSITASSYSIPEGQLIGTVLGDVFTIDDADLGDVFQYTLSGNNAHMLSVNEDTGTLSINKSIDYESGMTVLEDVTLTVTDQGGQSTNADLRFSVWDINDNAPQFATPSYTASVTEGGMDGQALFDFVVTDEDAGVNGEYTIIILSPNNVGSMYNITGTTLFANPSNIDYETLASTDYKHVLTVVAIDTPVEGQTLTGTTLVTVTVAPSNEFTPEWSNPVVDVNGIFPNVTVMELPFGSLVANFSAEDGDDGEDGRMVFEIRSITSSDGSLADGVFTMRESDGVGRLYTSSQLVADTETGGVAYYEVVITAADAGGTPRSTTGTVTINIDGNKPVYTDPSNDVDMETWVLRAFLMATSAAMLAGVAIHARQACRPKAPKNFDVQPRFTHL
ncbi:protocadherin-16-like [Haliotis cracherodii]|uniref:protocadherin-16-like n=1 Tax=Haliotis cracherodii TaxID=6455 RepID=UPI0039E8E857